VSDLLCFDVGRRMSGWAQFVSRRLVRAGHCSFEELIVCLVPQLGSKVLIEFPNKEKHRKEIPLDDLLQLARRCGRLEQHYGGHGYVVDLVLPSTWKGSVPKRVMNDRVLSRLVEAERSLLPRRPRAGDYDHNMLDAVGIGLWKLGRLR
jgi:hypothetical protein